MQKKMEAYNIPNTTFTWCPTTPIIATATGSAIERSSCLELFRLTTDNTGTIQNSIGKVHSPSRFTALAWGHSQTTRPLGIITAGTQTGILEIWDPYIIANQDECNINDAFISQHPSAHTRSIFHMEFNIHQSNLLVTAGNDNEILIWDLINSPEKPYTPGAHTITYNENLTDVAWNSQVPYILATSFSSGRTGILDLRTKKEVMNLSGNYYLSSITWHPDNATQIATGSTDDSHPVVMLWDLRKAQTYEKSLQEHTKGVVDLSWCRQDSELLVSASKDGKILSWNPQTGSLVDTISDTDPWPYQIDFCPRNPNWLASSSINGEINIWSIEHDHKTSTIYKPQTISEERQTSARQPPKWLKRPIGATFSFGGKLVLFNNKNYNNHHQSDSIINHQYNNNNNNNDNTNLKSNEKLTPKLKIVKINDKELSQRSSTLEYAKIDHQILLDFVKKQSQLYNTDSTNHWHILKILFSENAREQLINHMGLDKEDIRLENFSTLSPQQGDSYENNMNHQYHHQQQLQINNNNIINNNTMDQVPTLSGIFRSVDKQLPKPVNDFFASADVLNAKNISSMESATRDKKITQAVAAGNFDLAVSLCLEDETRMSDALLLAISGGPDLFTRTRRLYLEKRTKVPYMQLLDNIVRQDLMSFVQNSHVNDWKLVLSTLCTFAPSDEFSVLCETLGNRLETAAKSLLEKNISLKNLPDPHQLIHQAVICYLAAGKLERVLPIWVSEVNSDHYLNQNINNNYFNSIQQQEKEKNMKSYNNRLQEFMEKITVFLSAIRSSTDSTTMRENVTDDDSITNATSILSLKDNSWMDLLFEKYCEYAELLASNGILDTAFKYISLVPDSFGLRCNHRMSVIRDRIYHAADQRGVIVLQKEPLYPFEPHHIIGNNLFPPKYQLQLQHSQSQQFYHHQPQQQQNQQQFDHQPYNQQYHLLQQQHHLHHLNNQPSLDMLKTRENFYTTRPNDENIIDTNIQDDALFMTARDIPFFDDHSNKNPQEYQRYKNNTTFFDSFSIGIQSKIEIQHETNDKQSHTADEHSYQDTTPLTLASESYITNDMDNTGYFDEKKHQHYTNLPTTPPVGPPTAQQVRALGIKQRQQQQQQQQQQQPPPPPHQHQYNQQQQYQNINDSSNESSLQTSPLQQQQQQTNIHQQQQRYHQNTTFTTSPQHQNSYDDATLSSNETHTTNNNQKGNEKSPPLQKSSPRFQTNKTQKSSPREQFQEKRRYVKGDRSNIKAEHLPIYHILYYSIPHSRQKLEPSQKKFWDDVDKRLGYLFDQLNNHEVSESVIQSLLELVDAYSDGKYEEAQNIQMNLVTTKYDECSNWLLALKRIIEHTKEKKELSIR